MILAEKDVFKKKVEVVSLGAGDGLLVSGLAGHSAYAVVSYEVVRIGEEDQVLKVKLAPAEAGLSGSFRICVALGKADRRLLFGDEKTVIWTKQ